jgi:hypothetical protein
MSNEEMYFVIPIKHSILPFKLAALSITHFAFLLLHPLLASPPRPESDSQPEYCGIIKERYEPQKLYMHACINKIQDPKTKSKCQPICTAKSINKDRCARCQGQCLYRKDNHINCPDSPELSLAERSGRCIKESRKGSLLFFARFVSYYCFFTPSLYIQKAKAPPTAPPSMAASMARFICAAPLWSLGLPVVGAGAPAWLPVGSVGAAGLTKA